MKQFASLVKVLGTSTKTNDKLEALADFFSVANDKDKVWLISETIKDCLHSRER